MVTRRRSARPSPLVNLGIAIAVLVGLAAMGVGGAAYLGLLSKSPSAAAKPSRAGLVPVPKSLVELKAFEKVQREHIYDLEQGDDSYFWLPKDQVERHPEWITRVDGIIGRVLARDKRAEFVFSEKDFLPEGSRTGIAAGVPEGKQGFFVDADKVPGLRLLKMGDRFDLIASLPEESANAGAEFGLLVGGIKARANKKIPLSGVRLLVQSGTVIALTDGRVVTTQGGLSLPQADTRGRANTVHKEQIAIAIDPEEVVPLTQALGAQLTIHAITQSGRVTEEVPRLDELAGLTPFPAAALQVKAYSRIRAQDLAEPSTGELRQYYFRSEAVPANWLRSVEDILGRVVRRDIEPGYIFSESDFLGADAVIRDVPAFTRIEADDLADPSNSPFIGRVLSNDLLAGQVIQERDVLPTGASPGIAGGIPAGKTAVSLSADQIVGLDQLMRGNRCDLVVATPFDLRKEMGGEVQVIGTATGTFGNRVVNTVVARDALVVNRRDSLATLALDPTESTTLAKALVSRSQIYCIAKPGEPIQLVGFETTTPPHSPPIESDPNPFDSVNVTETVVGRQRSYFAFQK